MNDKANGVTGRLGCSKPNMQNIPIRTTGGWRIRELFVNRVCGRSPYPPTCPPVAPTLPRVTLDGQPAVWADDGVMCLTWAYAHAAAPVVQLKRGPPFARTRIGRGR